MFDVTIKKGYKIKSTTDLSPYDLIIITGFAPNISYYGLNNIKNSDIPVMIIEYWDFWYSYKMGLLQWDSGDYYGTDTVELINDQHPITNGLNQEVEVYDEPWAVLYGASLNSLSTDTEPLIYSWPSANEAAVIVDDDRKIVATGIYDTTHYTDDAWELFDRILDHLLPISGGCITEGHIASGIQDCCDGLIPSQGCLPNDTDCVPFYYCTYCGDGTCSNGETPWGCAMDCDDLGSTGLNNADLTKAVVGSWADFGRWLEASYIGEMSFQERAEYINYHSWYGRIVGTVPYKMHENGTLRRIVKSSLPAAYLGFPELGELHDPVQISAAIFQKFGSIIFNLDGTSDFRQSHKYLEDPDIDLVTYYQSFDGIPVAGGAIYYVYNSNGYLIELNNNTISSIAHDTTPGISVEDAEDAIGTLLGGVEVEAENSALFIYPGEENRDESKLVYEIAANDFDTGEYLGAYQVDAFTAEVTAVHPVDWTPPFVPYGGDIIPDAEPLIELYNKNVDYADGYCVSGTGPDCQEYFRYGPNTPNHYSVSNVGLNRANDVYWKGVEPTSVSDGYQPSNWEEPDDNVFDPIAHLLWEIIRRNYRESNKGGADWWPGVVGYVGVVGHADFPFGVTHRSKMQGETVGYSSRLRDYSDKVNPHQGIYLMEGAENIGTVAHEFGHRVHQSGILATPSNNQFQESIGDAFDMIYVQKYLADSTAPDLPCYDYEGQDVEFTPGIGQPCYNVRKADVPNGFRHQNLIVPPIGINTRCSAIERLYSDNDNGEADFDENIWRSYQNPEAKNHGHGRAPRTADQAVNESSNYFSFDLVDSATNTGSTIHMDQYCEDSVGQDGDDICMCGGTYGTSHTNNGIHNRFFYNISNFPDANYTLDNNNSDPIAAKKQHKLVNSIYRTVSIDDYGDWYEAVLARADDLATNDKLDAGDVKKIRDSLRDTKLFQSTYQKNSVPSDMEIVWHWENIDDQRLYVFHRQEDGVGPQMGLYSQQLYYWVIEQKSGKVKQCELPDVRLESGSLVVAQSGFAPTAVHLGDRIWVGWNQFEQGQGRRGHLSYATLVPDDTNDSCGSWSTVNYDSDTNVYGSVRSTVVERGSVNILEEEPPEADFPYFVDCAYINCWEPPWEDWEHIIDPNPVDSGVRYILEDLYGYQADIPGNVLMQNAPETGQVVYSNPNERSPYQQFKEGIYNLVSEPGLGTFALPNAYDIHAPAGAKSNRKLTTRSLNRTLIKSQSDSSSIADSLKAFLPNTVDVIQKIHADTIPRPFAVVMDLWTPYGGGTGGVTPDFPEDGVVFDVHINAVVVSFLGDDPVDNGDVNVVVRQYAVDNYAHNDTVIGQAHYTPSLSTIGTYENVGFDLEMEKWISYENNNLLACTDFLDGQFDQGPEGQLVCKLFYGGDVVLSNPQVKKFGTKVACVGPEVEITASPRAVAVGDVSYIFYRAKEYRTPSSSCSEYLGTQKMKYVAFEGVDFRPVTYNSFLYGLEFLENHDGPSKVVTHIDTKIELPPLPKKTNSNIDWPVLAGSPYVNTHGALGYAGVNETDGKMEFYARGMDSEQ